MFFISLHVQSLSEMKYRIIASFLFLSLTLSVSSCGDALKRNGEVIFDIYSTNDTHSAIFDSVYVGGYRKDYSLSRLASFLEERRNDSRKYLLIDAGDHLQGDNSAYYFNFIDTAACTFSRIFSYLGYDALVVGNHDIETGPSVYYRFRRELEKAEIPYLAANITASDDGSKPFESYRVFNVDGARILLIGLTNENIKGWLPESAWKGLEFDDPLETLESLVPKIRRKEKADMVIVAIHSGIGDGNDNQENVALYLARKLKDVDIIFAAHDHSRYLEQIPNASGDSTLLITAGSKSHYLSSVSVRLEFKRDKVVSRKISGDIVDLAEYPSSEKYDEAFHKDFVKVKEFTNRKIGKNASVIRSARALAGPSEYMQLMHDVQKKLTGADISITAPLKMNFIIRKGLLTVDDVFKLCPFENTVYKIRMTGQEMDSYLERVYSNWIKTVSSEDDMLLNLYRTDDGGYRIVNNTYNLDSAFGIDYTVDATKPAGDRVTIAAFSDGRPFSVDSLYTVAISSYRFSGGGNLLHPVIEGGKAELESRGVSEYGDLRTALIDYISEMGELKIRVQRNWAFVPEDLIRKPLFRSMELFIDSPSETAR